MSKKKEKELVLTERTKTMCYWKQYTYISVRKECIECHLYKEGQIS